MNEILKVIKSSVYDPCGYIMSNLFIEKEGQAYDACAYQLNGHKIISRSAKITPKKAGQFVTCWKRNEEGITEPYHVDDGIDFYTINVRLDGLLGQFVFPKAVLAERKIMSTYDKDGKRGFRVYPAWDNTIFPIKRRMLSLI